MADAIEVTVDKSHLVTIGERLYGESIELIRELVNNAYDADATEVQVTIKDNAIIVEDNGTGMDLNGLRQYFNIGSPEKRIHKKSSKFERDRIGEFGIGKFASLSASNYFEVWTKKDEFQAKAIFDKKQWEQSGQRWQLPLEVEEVDHRLHNGTKVTLKGITKRFNLSDVEKRIIETVPIKAPDFSVYLNGHKVTARFIPGHRIPFLEGTEYGIIHGEIIITSQLDRDISEAGIECKVKQATIKRDFFGIQEWTKDMARIKGEVHADFLPIASDRTGFITDRPEYKKFQEVMNRVLERIKPVLEELSDYKENRRTRRTLTEVLDRVKKALVLNPDFCPEGLIPIADKEAEQTAEQGQPGYISEKKPEEEPCEILKETSAKAKRKRKRKPKVKRLTPTAVVKKLKLGQQGVSCCVDHLGPDGPECLTEGTVIYINRDHPLYQKGSRKKDTYALHIARLITQEITLMKYPSSPKQAYRRQSKLLRDAFCTDTIGDKDNG